MRTKLFLLLPLLILATSVNYSSAAIIAPSSTSHTEPGPAAVKAALAEFKSLSKSERKQKLKKAKRELKTYKQAKKRGAEPSTNTILLVILAILLPPLAVYLHQGEINNKFWITLLLFLLGITGALLFSGLFLFLSVIYALIVILRNN
jgi:uncharacterized membrane protein YqaE (UPF0057 family)